MQIRDKNLYYVGGIVRDEILGAKSFDTDFCYEGNAIEFARANELNVVKENPDFGTVRVLSDEGEIDIASTRTETYPKVGHLPVIDKIGCSLMEDLKRRDFTINAMAKNTLTSEIADYFGGLQDIKDKKLRVLHEKSFIDDPSRIIRGLKFAVRFGFELDEYTKKLQEEYLNNINYDMSYHRLKKELKETFSLNNLIAYQLFIEQGIYKLLGENCSAPDVIINPAEVINSVPNLKCPYMVYLGLFNLSNFELNKEELDIINNYNNIKKSKPLTDVEIYKLFKNIPLESVVLYAITVDYDTAMEYLSKLAKIKIEINGYDLKQLGIPQGKIYKEIFDSILKEKIANPDWNKNDEIEFVKKHYLS